MATPAPLGDNQRRAVESEARRICVGAGPGSGKTRVLVERIARGAREGTRPLNQVLALTFTENAAAEMKQRLTHQLADPALRRDVEQAAVSTIHGFCASLLREHAIEAGIDPRFRVLDEIEAGLLRVRVLRAVLDRFRDQQPQAFEESVKHFRQPVQQALLDAYEAVRSQGGSASETDGLVRPCESSAEVCRRVVARIDGVEAAARRLDLKYIQHLTIIRQGVLRAQRFHEAGSLGESLQAIEEARKQINFNRLRNDELNSDLKVLRDDFPESRPVERPLDTLRALASAQVEESGTAHRRTVADLLVRFERAYDAEKARLSALDFDDLERKTWDLLQDDALARAAAQRFQEILVDEYQDTSRLQARILEKLGADLRMFVVGDPKQSIYAFRNAEPANFDEAWRDADPQGQIPLLEDFRSRPEILAAVNTYFTGVPGFGGAAGFSPLLAVPQFDPKGEPSVEIWVTASDGDKQEGRQAEAMHIARVIQERVERQALRITNRQASDYDSGRPIGYGDIALLFRSTTDMGVYEAALRDRGIPYYAETGRGFYDTREVADIAGFLHLLDNERDELALAAVLRSPMFGLSDDALYLLATTAHEQRLRLFDALSGAVELAETDRGVLDRFLELFSRLRRESCWRPLDSLVREVVHATGYEMAIAASQNGPRRMANVLKLAGLARSWAASSLGVTAPGDLARIIDQFRRDEVRAGEAQVPAAEGAVRLMTMHAAKGLEFPMVILPDLSRGESRDRPDVAYLPEHGLGCGYRVHDDDLKPAETLTQLKIRWAKETRDEQEEHRVLFVAMTRAREHLVLSGSIKAGKELGKTRAFVSTGVSPQFFSEPPAPPTASAGPPRVFSIPVPSAGDPTLADQSDYIAAVTDVAEFAACPRRYYLGRYLGWAAAAGDTAMNGEGVSTVERGTLVHQLLAGKPGDYSTEIQALAQRFRESELGRRVTAVHPRRVEYSVAGKIDGHFLSGVVDLLAGTILVDYKTGRREEQAYRLQMLLYALLTGARETWLFYLDENAAVPVEWTAADMAQARAEVDRFFAAQRTLDFPAVVEEHCRRCPFAGRQCRAPQRQEFPDPGSDS